MSAEILSTANLADFIRICKLLEFNESSQKALELVWQLNENEEIREKAAELLNKYCSTDQLVLAGKTFKIFSSVNETLYLEIPDQLEIFEQFKSNIEPYETLLTTNSIYTEILMNLGRKLFVLFKMDDAACYCFEMVLRNNPEHADAYYSMGRIAEKKLQHEKALSYYEKAIEMDSTQIYAQMQAGLIKGAFFSRWWEAVTHFEEVISFDPYAADPYANIAEAYYHLEEFGHCSQFVDIALGINEFHEDALNLLGLLQWKVEKNPEAAILTFQKGLDHTLHADSAVLLKSLGDIYFEHFQDYEKAKIFYEKSLRVNYSQKKVIKKIVPILLHHFQDLKSVTNCYENFLIQAPDDFEIKTAYAGFLIEYKHEFDYSNKLLQESLKLNETYAETLKLLNRVKEYTTENENSSSDDDDDFFEGNASGDN